MKDDRLYLDQILERIARIEEFTSQGRDAFEQSLMMQDAVIRNFEVIGEAIKRVSPDLQATYPDVPWRRIADFRNVLIHDYDEVKLHLVWRVVQDELPTLKQQLTHILRVLDAENPPEDSP